MTDEIRTTDPYSSLRDEMLARAKGFAAHPGLFNGKNVAEELRHWAAELEKLIHGE